MERGGLCTVKASEESGRLSTPLRQLQHQTKTGKQVAGQACLRKQAVTHSQVFTVTIGEAVCSRIQHESLSSRLGFWIITRSQSSLELVERSQSGGLVSSIVAPDNSMEGDKTARINVAEDVKIRMDRLRFHILKIRWGYLRSGVSYHSSNGLQRSGDRLKL